MAEEFLEADVLWPWPDTPPPDSPAPELYESDATVVVDFSCEPFSDPGVASSLSSASTSSALLFDRSSGSEDGFFLSGPSTVASVLAASTEEFLEADVLWPDTADDEADGDAAEFWCCRRVEAAHGKQRDGWSKTMVSSPIDIPVAITRAAIARRRLSPSAVLGHRRR